jgi:hypothetical protein
MRRFILGAFIVSALPALARAQDTILDFDGQVPEGEETHFFVDFDVPEGVVELEVRHESLTTGNILDFGLDDPDGFRGWGGGNTEPAIVGLDAASRSYVPGPIPSGVWRVVVGKAKIVNTPAEYSIQIVLRAEPTLESQAERQPYAPASPLEIGRRWYAGDFHVHSRESGDANATLDQIADLARDRGLDFVVITDHNTHTGADFFADAQARHPDVLFVPGVEYTTYAGHANAIGAVEWVNHRVGVEGATIQDAFDAYVQQGAIVSINHPVLDLGNACIGCAWKHTIDAASVGAVEIETADIDTVGFVFTDRALAFWDELLDAGSSAVALGGSDDHRAGVDLSGTQSPIGSPTTMVEADELSVDGILEGIRRGRTSVKMGNPDDPLAYIDMDPASGIGSSVTLTLHVVGGAPGQKLVLVENGVWVAEYVLDAPTQSFTHPVRPGADATRYRVEVFADRHRAVSSHVVVSRGDESDGAGCGCAASSAGDLPLPLALVLALHLLSGARRARRPRA